MSQVHTCIALLRAVNVGGTGKLPMATLVAMCEALGFTRVRTYIASGNVVFDARVSPEKARAALEARLADHAGKPVGVVMRSPAEMAATLQANPFPNDAPNRVVAIFFEQAPEPSCLQAVRGRRDEQLALVGREIWVSYGDGMADSKLVIPAARSGTARNLNTVAKLAAIAAGKA